MTASGLDGHSDTHWSSLSLSCLTGHSEWVVADSLGAAEGGGGGADPCPACMGHSGGGEEEGAEGVAGATGALLELPMIK